MSRIVSVAPGTSGARGGMIANLQVARAFAAISVVFAHLASPAGLNLPFYFGNFGVDIFFVISGFIISYISVFDPSQFFTKRLIRIVPFYWTATLAIFAIALLFPTLLRSTNADPLTLLTSLFFIPHAQRHGYAPVLLLGWTLNFEMYFYCVFAISLALARKFARGVCAALIIGIYLLMQLLPPDSAVRDYYGNPIVFEFLFGMCLFQAYRSGGKFFNRPGGALGGMGALVVALGVAVWLPVQETYLPEAMRFVAAGIPAALGLGMVLLLEKRYRLSVRNKILLLLGDASYILYLIHPYIVYGVLRVVLRSASSWQAWGKWLLVPVLISVSAAIAIAVHSYFERPVIESLRRRFVHRGRGTAIDAMNREQI